MRAMLVAAMLSVMMMAGCAEEIQEPEEVTSEDPHVDPADEAMNETVEKLAGQFVATLDNSTYAMAMPFNVTLDYVGDDINATNVTWQITFTQILDNATGNATGNDTVEMELGNSTSYSGVGLPAVVEANITEAGNYTLTGILEAELGSAELDGIPIMIEGVAVAGDPCAGAPTQDTISESGIVGPGALSQGTAEDHVFQLMPCQSKMVIDVSTTTADVIIRLILPDGSHIDYDANFVGGDTMTYEPGGFMEAGEYNAQIRHYATVADQYELTITFS